MSTPTRSTSRRKPTAVSAKETQGALDVLVAAMTDDFVSPNKAVAGSAASLLVQTGICSRPHRASYVLSLLVEAGAIEPIEKSHSYRIKRSTVIIGRSPLMPSVTQEAYEETIRRLNRMHESTIADHTAEVGRLNLELMELKDMLVKANAFVQQLEADKADLAAQLNKLDQPVQPASDVRAIMDKVLRG